MERGEEMKCKYCGNEYDGRTKTCWRRECKRAYQKAYKKTDKYKAYQKAYKKTDKYKAYQKAYRKAYYQRKKKEAGKA